MVFHRYLEGQATNAKKLHIKINERAIQAWDPFCPTERTWEVCKHSLSFGNSEIKVRGYVLPPERDFSSKAAFKDAAGVKRWNESQGFYVYRSDRLIKWGGWLRMKASEPHLAMARIAIDFPPELDQILQLDVQKSKIELPMALRNLLDPIATDVRSKANTRYRLKTSEKDLSQIPGRGGISIATTRRKLTATAFVAILEETAVESGQVALFEQLQKSFRKSNPEVAKEIGW